jgi:endo-1,4-beta-xylanase
MKTRIIRQSAILLVGSAIAFAGDVPALKDAFKDHFLVGAAVNHLQTTGQDALGAALVKAQFNTITPENVLKWERVHPYPAEYAFDASDRYVEFGEKNHMFIVGHTLVWHSQTPKWVFQDENGKPLTRDALLTRMRDHIHSVVGRYKGRVNGWDVVNEALAEDGTLRETPWLKIIGEDYIEKAFEYAHEADPAAQLYYNDYSIENEKKRDGAVALLRKLKEKGVPVYGIGIQGHDNLKFPTVEQLDAAITAFAKLGVKVMITEFDINVLPSPKSGGDADVSARLEAKPSLDPYKAGLPEEVEQKLASRYAELFSVLVKHSDVIDRVTFWGVSDADTWLNNWPIRGRTNYPLLFDREHKPKPAFEAVLRTAQQ